MHSFLFIYKSRKKKNSQLLLIIPVEFFSCFLTRKDTLKYLEEHWDAVELKLNPWWSLVWTVLWEAVLQDRRQGDESHCAVEGIPIDENLRQRDIS